MRISRQISYLQSMLIALFILLFPGCTGQPRSITGTITPEALESQPVIMDEYIIQVSDVLDVKIYKHPDLSEQLTVRPDGKISMQLIDDIKAAGLTPMQLDEAIAARYSEIIKEPSVTVIVREFSALQVFVGGEVVQPGIIPLRSGLTCLQALFQAGGYKKTARPENIVILRFKGTQQPEIIILNLSYRLLSRGQYTDILLRNKDIVFVPRSVISDINLFIDQYIKQLIPAQMTLGLSYTLY